MLALFYQIFTFANVTFMLKGLAMSVSIAVLATVISMFFGTILALIRTYANGPLQWASSLVAIYTEFFRCTPNLLWILWIYFTVKGNKIAVSVFAISLFTSAVMAEIFRGGLNSIPKGQFEAAQSQGFSFLQTLWYIIMPIALPGIAVVATFAFTMAWNEYLYAMIMTTSNVQKTATVAISGFKYADSAIWGRIMSASVVCSLPVTLLYIVAQSMLISGKYEGSVK